MNRDEFRGAKRHLKGRARSTLGGITGDAGLQVRGAVDQIVGGAQHTYGRARDRAEDLIEDGTQLVRESRRRGEHLLDDGARYAQQARRRSAAYGRHALGYASENRGTTLFALAAAAFVAGWILRPAR